jgi:hypothetical protein
MAFGLKEAVLAVSLTVGAIGCGKSVPETETHLVEGRTDVQVPAKDIEPQEKITDLSGTQAASRLVSEYTYFIRDTVGICTKINNDLRAENQALKTQLMAEEQIINALDFIEKRYKGTPQEKEIQEGVAEILSQLNVCLDSN